MFGKTIALLWRSIFSGHPEKRYASKFELLSALSRRLGFALYNRNLSWQIDDEFREAWKEFSPGKKAVKDRRFVLFSMAMAQRNVPGDTAECGVYDGASSYLICHANEGVAGRRHHVFDSFEGLSEPAEIDSPVDPRAYKWRKHDLSVAVDVVRKNLSRFDSVSYYKGWIPDRFCEVEDCRFSLVHIDVDLYQPTYDSLSFFYERLVRNGIILCDDYGSTICPGAKAAFDQFILERPEHRVMHLTTGQGFIVKR